FASLHSSYDLRYDASENFRRLTGAGAQSFYLTPSAGVRADFDEALHKTRFSLRVQYLAEVEG
ncbi:MAG: hypothetical protein MK538_15955, partial [Planctomycetes bacterium]|nr:hypothetical protein [Planctomycetota bacterium]